MTLRTWLGFLVGRADCIELAAKSRGILALGLVFVISAGLAREYDQEDLLHEPWHALLPLIVSLVTSLLLYCLLQLFTAIPPNETRQFWRGYRSFLGLYWLMAPMAWLYAIPAERFFAEEQAVMFNLCLLAAVSVWRVVLMIRIVHVLWKPPVWAAAAVVGWFSLTVAIQALAISPRPILNVMGGVRLSAAEHTIANVTFFLQLIFVLAWPFALFLVFGAYFRVRRFVRPSWSSAASSPDRSLWMVAATAILGVVAVLPFTQGEQQRRHHIEFLLESGRIEEGLEELARLGPRAFPPHWDPPPRVTFRTDPKPNIADVMEVHFRKPLPPWLEEIYVAKLINAFGYDHRDRDEGLRLAGLMLRIPNLQEVLVRGHFHYHLDFPVFRLPESDEKRELEKILKRCSPLYRHREPSAEEPTE